MSLRLRISRAASSGTQPPIEPPIEPPVAGAARLTGLAYNSNQHQQYFGTSPYLNLFKNNFSDWNSGGTPVHTRDQFEQLATLPHGASCSKTIWAFFAKDVTGNVKNGSYTIKWAGVSGSNIAVNVTGAGVSGGNRVDGNTYTFNWTYPGAGDSKLTFVVQNFSGASAFPVTNVRCVWTTYLPQHEAGEIFCPDYLACMVANPLAYRMTGPLQIWGNPTSGSAQVRPFEADAWGAYLEDYNAQVVFYTGQPYEVGAEFGKKMNCDIICPVPLAGTQECYDVIGARMWSRLSARPDVHIILTIGNENWSTAQNNQWFAGPAYLNKYKDENGIANAPQAEAQKLLMAARGFLNAGFPRSQLIITPELQLYGSWNHLVDGYGGMMMQYVDSAGLVSAGKYFHEIIDRINTAPYQHMHLDSGGYGGALFNWQLLALDWVNLTDAQILHLLQNDNDEISYVIDARVAEMAAVAGRTIPIGSYEWGNEVVYQYENKSGVYPQFIVNGVTNELIRAPGYEAFTATDGDVCLVQNTFMPPAGNNSNYTGPNPGVPGPSIVDGGGYAFRNSPNGFRLYNSSTGANSATSTYATDALAKAASIPLYTGYGSQQYTINNDTRYWQFIDRMEAFNLGPGGGTAITALHAATIGPTKIRYPCQYFDVGGWPAPRVGQDHWYGLKRGKYQTDTPRMLAYKALNPPV
jgi:hypothetical protein